MTLREKIINMLESKKGEFISGQDIADAAEVSRSAVSKYIGILKTEGYNITSVNNMGHRLETDCDILSVGGIAANLCRDDVEIRVFKTIDSTNTEAKRAIANGMESTAIFAAEEQTSGRGRRGRSFYSPGEGGLYFSCVLHPEVGLADSTALTTAAAVAVCEAIGEETKKDPVIKWVNDIFIDGYKVCGILTEAVSDFESGRVQAAIVGIGINLTTRDFPEELKGIASAVGSSADRCKLIADIYKRLDVLCNRLPDRSYMEKYRKYSMVLGKEICFSRNGKDYTAKAVSIHDDGGLEVLTDENKALILNSGEISIKMKKL